MPRLNRRADVKVSHWYLAIFGVSLHPLLWLQIAGLGKDLKNGLMLP
jgi:hypothetical protein